MAYVRNGADGKGWNVTIGDDELVEHFSVDAWGWHARAASGLYLGAEFAQPTVDHPISDAQVRAFAWWFVHRVQPRWPGISYEFPTHVEVEARGETGRKEGHTDVFPLGDPRVDDLRARILALIR
ncbi:MAG: hypothetical protein EPO21_13210 [Chloroflexota bacterium]|nr:MAG: hypothetical protein EPO21_13210 [Chloroflexota bacterium]